MMKKYVAIILTLALTTAALMGCSKPTPTDSTGTTNEANGTSEDKQLNLFTWENMFPQEVLDDFTKQTGIKVNYVNFDYDETMLAKLEASKGGDYDLVIADDYIIKTAISEGLVQKLDKDKLSNYGNINPLYQGQFYDETDEYTVPHGAGIQTIVYDPAQVTTDIKSYQDLWSTDLKDNIGLIANYRVVNGIALKIAKKSYNTENIADIEAAGKKLLDLAPNVRLIKDDSIQEDLISGEIGAAVMYTSQVTMAKLANPDLKVVFPEEGIGFGIMANFIPSNAPHPDAAHQFMNYILDPEVSAKCFEFLGYYCTNKVAEQYINEEYKSFLTLPEDFKGDMEMIQNISAEAEEAHTKVWTEFKSASGQ